MILSNEPGYYRDGSFGIRLENLVLVVEAAPLGDRRDQLAMQTLTWVPFDRRLIDVGQLARHERDWVDAYHAEVLARVGPDLSAPARDWLEAACAPL